MWSDIGKPARQPSPSSPFATGFCGYLSIVCLNPGPDGDFTKDGVEEGELPHGVKSRWRIKRGRQTTTAKTARRTARSTGRSAAETAADTQVCTCGCVLFLGAVVCGVCCLRAVCVLFACCLRAVCVQVACCLRVVAAANSHPPPVSTASLEPTIGRRDLRDETDRGPR